MKQDTKFGIEFFLFVLVTIFFIPLLIILFILKILFGWDKLLNSLFGKFKDEDYY